MDDLDSIKPIFFEECSDLLAELEQSLAALVGGASDQEIINAAFRAVHSIKGGAGSFGMVSLVRYAHVFESALDLLRSGKIKPQPEILSIFLQATDILSDLTIAEQGADPVDENIQNKSIKELEELEKNYSGKEKSNLEENNNVNEELIPGFVPVCVDFLDEDTTSEKNDSPNSGFEIFSNLKNNSVNIPVHSEVSEEEFFVEEKEGKESEKIIEKKIDNNKINIEKPSSAIVPPSSIRVEVRRIDRLMDLVGELVIGQATLRDVLNKKLEITHLDVSDGAINDVLSGNEQITREIQDAVMAVRAQPIQSVFQRMQRVVRESARIADKDVTLSTFGEDTEVDRTVVEKLADPLTHMLRNAVDHGIESSEKRMQAGKSSVGNICLSAEHKSGRIVITVTDDGNGINRDRVRQIAIEKGIILDDALLSDNEIDNLIFAPGFSTASTVSALSGRGVGMDVVKKSITELGGRVSIESREKRGTKFTVSLPLTLAVMDGMSIIVADQTYIIPVSSIVETMIFEKKYLFCNSNGKNLVCIRGDFLPLVELRSILPCSRDEKIKDDDLILIIVETENGSLTALLVDGIEGQMQVVMKSVENNYKHIKRVSSATILGNGRVSLILDVASLVENLEENVQFHDVESLVC